MAAGIIGHLDRCMEATIEYCAQRKAFGKSILDNQYLHFRLAELQTEVSLSDVYLWKEQTFLPSEFQITECYHIIC